VREYLVGGLGPGEGAAAVVPAVDEVLDGGDEVLDRTEAAAADGLPGDLLVWPTVLHTLDGRPSCLLWLV